MPLRAYDQDQMFLLPPSLNEWVGQGHPARIFSDIVDRLDTSKFRISQREGRPAYHPRMMVKVLLWGYATGIRSSRKIEERLHQDVSFMWLSGMEKPDFRTLCLFRTGNKDALEHTFTKVVALARGLGMASLVVVALDGSKVRANSGIDTFKKVEDWREALKVAREKVRNILAEAEETDKAEDGLHGAGKSGRELPEGMERRQRRIEAIEAVLKYAEASGKGESARISPVDMEASFMHKANTSIPAYNVQAAVTEDQVIIYADVTTEPVDVNQIKPAVEGIEAGVGCKPEVMLADAGYTGGANLKYLEEVKIAGYIPEGSEKHIGKDKKARAHLFGKEEFRYDKGTDTYTCPGGRYLKPVANVRQKTVHSTREATVYRAERGVCGSCDIRAKCTDDIKRGRSISRDGYEEYREKMRSKLKTEDGKAIYGKRKCLVEPVFGQMKVVGGLTQFLLRGLEKVKMEWKLASIAHNILKITRQIMNGKRLLPAYG